MKYLIIDTETGGLSPEIHSLLTVGFVVMDNEKIIDTTEFKIKHKNFVVTPEALNVNKINLLDLNEEISDVMNRMVYFLGRHFKENERIVLMGHNVSFDIGFIKKFWIENLDKSEFTTITKEKLKWEKRFSHHYVDTMQIAKFLVDCKKLPIKSVSLENLIDYFNLKAESRHTALEDAIMTGLSYRKLKELVR